MKAHDPILPSQLRTSFTTMTGTLLGSPSIVMSLLASAKLILRFLLLTSFPCHTCIAAPAPIQSQGYWTFPDHSTGCLPFASTTRGWLYTAMFRWVVPVARAYMLSDSKAERVRWTGMLLVPSAPICAYTLPPSRHYNATAQRRGRSCHCLDTLKQCTSNSCGWWRTFFGSAASLRGVDLLTAAGCPSSRTP